MKEERILLVDGNNVILRAYFSMKNKGFSMVRFQQVQYMDSLKSYTQTL